MKKMMKRGFAAVLGLSLCVSMMTPVFAEEAKVLKCGMQTHTHTSACYVQSAELICELAETEVQRVDTKTVTKTVIETQVDEETGEEVEVEVEVEVEEPVYQVVTVHTHGPECYEETAELVCGLEEHTHEEACYGDRTVDTGAVATPPETFEAEAEDGTKAEVTVDSEGKATVTVGDKVIEATVTTETKTETVGTAIGEKVETTSKEISRVENEDGSITVETEYTTTYTTQDTTGYWVTYTVTYTVPITYSVDEEKSSSDVTVDVGEDGTPTVTGIKEGAVTLKGDDEKEYTVTKGDDGKYYVEIGGTNYEVEPTVSGANGNYTVSWSFADGVDTSDVKYQNGTGKVDKTNMPAGVQITDGQITLTGETVTLGDTVFTVKGGKLYFMNGDEECEVELTVTGDATKGYTLSWSYDYTPTNAGDDADDTPTLPENVTATVASGKLMVKGPNGEELATADNIEGHTIQSVSTTEDGKAKVTCTDKSGNVYIYVINATQLAADGTSYEIEYQPVKSVTTSEVNPEGAAKAKNEIGKNDKGQYCEFIAIALPDGSYVTVAQGDYGNTGSDVTNSNKGAWLANGEATNVKVTANGNTITISYTANRKTQSKSYTFEDLAGLDITNIVYKSESSTVNSGGQYDCIIVNIAGIVVKDEETGEVKTLTLTASDDGLKVEPTTVTGSIGTGTENDPTLGGVTNQPKYVYVSSLTGSAVVVVKTEGGNEVEMTYSEYLEATAQGEDLELVGVLASTIPPETTEETEETTDPEETVIPVIPDPVDPAPVDPAPAPAPVVVDEAEIPMAEEPEVEIEEPDVPLNELPEEIEIEIEESEIPLADEAEIELDDPAVPLSDVPKTGDISVLWYAAAAVSASGLAATFALKKREDQEDPEI